ncbi:hypothetical protein QQ045_021151 [Rhodiola kirilowii]
MSKSVNISKLARGMKFENFMNCAPTNSHIWIMWTNNISVKEFSYSQQHITVEVNLIREDISTLCSFVYASVDMSTRQQLWDELSMVADQCGLPWLVCGDFNTILSFSEKLGGRKKRGKAIRDFNDFINRVGVSDVGFKGNMFTWSNNQEGKGQVWERLDRCLDNGDSLATFQNLEVHHLPRQNSDHCPLMIKLHGDVRRRTTSFKFIGAWTKHKDFLDIVKGSWAEKAHENPLLNFALKLKRLRGSLRKWNWEKFGDINRKVKELSAEVERLEGCLQEEIYSVCMSDVRKAKDDLSIFLRFQQLMLEEKSKAKWLVKGERNRKLFHASIKARRIQNRIRLLMADGTQTEDAESIGNEAVAYFQKLFYDFPNNTGNLPDGLINPIISDTQNLVLTQTPDEDEIKLAVQGMNPSSSPGPDGFTGKNFSLCWEIITRDLIEAVRGFFHGLQIPNSISSAYITLLPKVKNASSFDQVRPISLCNFVHIIISRILNDRMKAVLPDIISKEQAGFVAGRNIHDSIGLAHDLVKDIDNKVFGGNVLVKLDMSKAYDRLSWRFLLNMLRALGFSEVWCDLIYRNIANCWYSIAWDGKCYGHFKSNRGVRQGDPLSPSLFLIAMEFFSQMINQAFTNGKLTPYKPKGGRMDIHHLLYADDMLVFSNGHKNCVRKLLGFIYSFCDASGQMLNPDKSKIFFSKGFMASRRKDILELTNFREGKFPVIYLGAPLFPGKAKAIYFKYLEDVVKGQIASWAKNFLSISGRAVLISSVLSSVSIHTLSILPVPKVVINGLERLMRNFLWDRGASTRHHWVNWEVCCLPKDEGGLGMRNLQSVKKCLLSKLAWKFLQNSSLWAKYARHKYLYSSYSSAIWSAIQPYIRRLRRNSCWEIGRGEINLAHFCEWLRIRLPKEAQTWMIKDVTYQPAIKEKFLGMLEGVLRGVVDNFLLSNKPDRLLWRGCESGKFTTKAYYESIRPAMPKSNLFKHTWHAWLPPKISAFLWKLWRKALPTDDNIIRIGFLTTSKCWCCKHSSIETLDHIFIKSDLAAQAWPLLAWLFDKKAPSRISMLQQDWFVNSSSSNFMDCLSFGLAACSVWEIWLSRNNAMYGDPGRPLNKSIPCWAASLAPNIQAEYKPSFHRQIALDYLHISYLSNNIKGNRTAWSPAESGLTLNLAVFNFWCAGILRDSSGTLHFAFRIKLEYDDFIKGVISSIMLLNHERWPVFCVQCSHQDSRSIGSENFGGNWAHYNRWKEGRQLMDHTKVVKIDPALNDAAIALCFKGGTDGIFYKVSKLPKVVRVALTRDYLRLPTWLRKGRHQQQPCDINTRDFLEQAPDTP